MVIKFDDAEQLQFIAGFVESVFNIYRDSCYTTIVSLNNKLKSIDSETISVIDLSKDEVTCLGKICAILNDICSDDIIAGCSVYSKITKLINTNSDVPRFLAMLKENNVPAEHCVGLFSSWCSNEGTAYLAEKCMEIQSAYNIDMTAVWKWVYNNKCSMHTDWTEEVGRFKEAIND